MEFLKSCAKRLDEGNPTSEIMEEMRARYTTPRSLNVKCCLVRKMCQPSAEYRICSELLCEAVADEDAALAMTLRDAIARNARPVAGSRISVLMHRLPHRLPFNVYSLRVTQEEVKECKRLSVRQALVKNRTRVVVDGRCLLESARADVARPHATRNLATLALSLMLLTGRRTCEILNGRSTFLCESDYSLRFTGQAKKRILADDEDEEGGDEEDEQVTSSSMHSYSIPTLAPATQIISALAELRRCQGHMERTNRATSLKYQAWVGQVLRDRGEPWTACGHAHALRGLYACMAAQLFDWGSASDAYVTMSILGHAGLQESLVYTTYSLGPAFRSEPMLGKGPELPDIQDEDPRLTVGTWRGRGAVG